MKEAIIVNSGQGNRWLIVLGTVMVQMGLGTIYTWSLFNQPLDERFGWELSSIAITFTITSFALAFSTLFAGQLQDIWGIRRLIAYAGFILGVGLILSSQVSSLWMLYITAGIVVGFADGTAYITSLSNLIKWFPEKKGLISGISVGAYGTGSLLFKYINGSLIQSVGVSQAFGTYISNYFKVKEKGVKCQQERERNSLFIVNLISCIIPLLRRIGYRKRNKRLL